MSFYKLATTSNFAALVEELELTEKKIAPNLRNWEHLVGASILNNENLDCNTKILGLGVGKETFNHYIASTCACVSSICVISDFWGIKGWFESSPKHLFTKDNLYKESETTFWESNSDEFNRLITMNLDFREPFPFAEDSFDIVYSFSSIEHTNQFDSGKLNEVAVKRVFREVYRILRSGGCFICTLPFDVKDFRFGTLFNWEDRIKQAGFEIYIESEILQGATSNYYQKLPKDLITSTTNYVKNGLHSSVAFVLIKA